MPDPVSCHPASQGSPIVQCDDVVIGPEKEARPAVVMPDEPGVRALVERYAPEPTVRRETLPHVAIDFPVAEAAGQCASKGIGVGLAVVAARAGGPLIAGATALKAGMEIGECVRTTKNEAQQSADLERAIEHCKDQGYTPVGIIENEVTCERFVEVRQ